MTISSKVSRVVSCIFERISMTLDILEHSIEHGRICRNWRWLCTPLSFRIKLLVQQLLAYFFIILLTDVSVFCMYLPICSGNVSSIPTLANLSFVRNFTLVRIWRICVKISNNPYRFFWHNRDYIERFSTDCWAIVVGAIFDKQLSEHYVRKNGAILILNKLK